jgi:hypothetical protein
MAENKWTDQWQKRPENFRSLLKNNVLAGL